jgi:2-hydroxychromene-2-carboxylate isomerase
MMTTQLDFYFDVGSPTAYLAYRRLQQLRDQHPLEIRFLPILLGGIFKATDNTSPVAIPAKGAYMMAHDLPRFAKRYGVPLNPNPHFPINTLNLMRGAIAAQRQDCLEPYLDCIFDGIWVNGQNLGDPDVARSCLESAGLDAETLLAGSQQPEVKQALIDNTEQAVSRGAFGAPTFFIGDEMFFGQDRLDFVEERLAG